MCTVLTYVYVYYTIMSHIYNTIKVGIASLDIFMSVESSKYTQTPIL